MSLKYLNKIICLSRSSKFSIISFNAILFVIKVASSLFVEIVSIIFNELFDLLSEYKLSSIELIGIELSNAKVISSFGVFKIFDISP